MKKVYFITGNKGKFASAQKYLAGLEIELLQKDMELVEPQADTVREVAQSKAQQAAHIIQSDAVFVMDSGLVVPGLNGFPGVYTKYIQETIMSEGLLALVNERCPDNRYAYFEQTIAYLEDGEVEFFSERYDGEIGRKAATHNKAISSWGDLHRIFVPKGWNKTLIEMSEEEKTASCADCASQPDSWQQMRTFLQKMPVNA